MKYLSALFMMALLACNAPKSFTGETEFAGPSEQGTILVNAAGYGQSKILAIENAEVNALKNILFKGIPGSNYTKPVIENASKAQSQFPDYFKNLFQGGKYKTFLMTSTVQGPYDAFAKRRSNIRVKVKYDVNAIRKDLENQGVIRAFGF